MKEKRQNFYFPLPGQRLLRSVCAVFLCFVIYFIRGQNGIPFYSALAVIQCMQPYQESSIEVGKNRTKGTMIGAFWGTVIVLLVIYGFGSKVYGGILYYLLVSVFTGIVIYSTVILNCKNTAYFSSVVFLSITVMHVGDAVPILFVFDRVLDTMIGIVLALCVNSFHLPRRRQTDILFISGLDDTILTSAEELSAYSKVELNRLIERGANFTVSTLRTPAGIREVFAGVNLKLPVIAMDGAVLYDMNKNSFLMSYQMNFEDAKRIQTALKELDVCFFTNVVIDDILVIYYKELSNDAQRKIYESMSGSPYRNYVRRLLPEGESVVYFMVIEKREKAQEIYRFLEEKTWARKYRIITYDSRDYPGYAYVKIYNRNATRENMLKNLCALLNLERTVTFGSVPGKYDVCVHDSDRDETVKALKRAFEPLIWKRGGCR